MDCITVLTSRNSFWIVLLSSCFLVISACSKNGDTPASSPTPEPPPSSQARSPTIVVNDKALSDESLVSEWLAYGGTHYERRYSPLQDVNTETVSGLKVEWYLDLPGDNALVSTPLVVNGTVYFTGTRNIVRAVDAVSGELLWTYDPELGRHLAEKRRLGAGNSRGISFYEGKVFVPTADGRLIALDAKDGKALWSTQTIEEGSALYITGAPKAFKGKVLIGNGGTEIGPTRGYVTAYDADTGEQAWRFYIVPGNPADGFESEAMEMAAETWKGEWWKHGGGGNVWHGITYDPDLDALYIGTGNGSPWNQNIRSPGGGDNLFLCSVVALNPDTGEYLWHYQTTPGETWDYNSNMDIVLADLEVDGETVKALLHAPKNGFFYVINRENGELISAEPFADVNWASHVDMKTGKPVEIEGARYDEGTAEIAPGPWGAHSWHAMSYNPDTGLAYIPALHMSLNFTQEGVDVDNFQAEPFRGGVGTMLSYPDPQPRDYPASLIAWDPVKQQAAWEIEQEHFWNAGTLTTAGNLVFQGRPDGMFLAYDARNGDMLWSTNLGLGISAPPITYKIGDTQYIALLVGWGGAFSGLAGQMAADRGWAYGRHMRRLVTFSLDGSATLPVQPPPEFPQPLAAPDFVVDETLAVEGRLLFQREKIEGICWVCHGEYAVAGGQAPDLRASPIVLDAAAFDSVVRGGGKTNAGMPRFPALTDRELESLRHYIRQQAALEL
jgi:quinohemoprotein ethanol dehydrogenase